MKKNIIISVFIASFLTQFATAQKITTPIINEGIELMSTVFRLAEADEFSQTTGNYADKVDAYFAPYKEHRLIAYTQTLRNTFAIGYDAVINLAIMLEINNNRVRLNPKIDISQLDERWPQDSIANYIALLNDFYRKARYAKFMAAQTDFYAQVCQNFQTYVVDGIDIGWFERFFGIQKSNATYRCIPGLLTGTGNYGPSVKLNNGDERIYSIIGSWSTDSLGIPIYMSGVNSIVIHEFCHTYCNPLIEQNYHEMEKQASEFFNLYANAMRERKYNHPKTYLKEIFVNACSSKYLNTHSDGDEYAMNKLINEYKNMGYLWIDTLYKYLNSYDSLRGEYVSLASYMPEIIKKFNSLDVQQMYIAFESQRPEILGTNIENRSDSVDFNTAKIIVYFDRPMNLGNNGLSPNFRCKSCMLPTFVNNSDEWSDDGKSWSIGVTLEPNTRYSIEYPNFYFWAEKGFYRPKNSYILTFRTRER